MKNIKLYELEETYHSEKSSLEFPTVSYTIDTDKVWYMKNNQIKMMFSITEDDVNNYNGEDLMVWENSVLFDSVKVDGVEQKVPLQEKNVIITGETSGEVVVDITLDNSVTQGEVVLPQPRSMATEEDGNSSSELPYIINITDENKLPYSSGKITVKLTNTSLNNLSYRPSFYVRYTPTIDVKNMIERTEYALLDWYTAQDSFSMLVNDDGTEMTLTLPSEVNITHLFIVPMNSRMVGDVLDEPLESQVEGIYLDENGLLYSYETNNIILPCQLICGGGFIFDESCYINDQNIKKCSILFDEPISEEKLIDADKYFLTILFQGYNDGMWIDYNNFTQPLSVLIENGYADAFIVNEKSELIGLDLYYSSDGLVSVLGPTARMLAHVVYDGNAVYDEENNNFIVNVNEETLVDSYINMIIGGVPLLSLPTTEVKNYEVVVSKYEDMTDMSEMFRRCSGLTSLDLSSFDTSNVTTMENMFNGCTVLTSITFGDNFDTSNVTDMRYMFNSCKSLTSLDLSNFNTSKVTDMSGMFAFCNGLTSLDLSNFDTSNVTDMSYMFNNCTSLTSLDLSSFDTSNVTNISNMCANCNSLTSLTLTDDISHFSADRIQNAFLGASSSLTIYHASACDLTWHMSRKVSTELANATFVPALKNDWELNYIRATISPTSTTTSYKLIGNLNVVETMSINGSAITPTVEYTFSEIGDYTIEYGFIKDSLRDTSDMFNGCSGLTSLDLSNLDTSNVTDMYRMFYNCSGLTSLDLSNFDTSKVTNMGGMFQGCYGLTSLDLSNFNTSKVTNMS